MRHLKTLLMFASIFFMPLLLVLVLNFIFSCKANALEGHPIHTQIVKNNPKINKKRAMYLSNIIYRKARKYDISAKILTAILAQESMYRMVQGSCSTGFFKIDMDYIKAEIPVKMKNAIKEYTNEKMTICEDFGIGQINYKNIERFGMDKERLLTDLEYSVEMAAFMLYKTKKYYHKKDSDWVTRYNAYSPDKRNAYRKLLEKYL